jgi:ribosomal protein L21E
MNHRLLGVLFVDMGTCYTLRMRLADIHVGDKVRVRRGYSVRPAHVDSIYDGKVGVTFDDVPRAVASSIPDGYRGNLLGATVRPNAVEPATEQPKG